MTKPSIENWDRLEKPVRLSSRDMWVYRYVAPIFLSTFFVALTAAGIVNRRFVPLLLAAVYFFVMSLILKRLWRLVDVYADERHIEFRRFRKRVRIPYHQLVEVEQRPMFVQSCATNIYLAEPCEFGEVVRFEAYFCWFQGMSLKSALHPANDLIKHLKEQALMRNVALLGEGERLRELDRDSEISEPEANVPLAYINPHVPVRLSTIWTALSWYLAPLTMPGVMFLYAAAHGDRLSTWEWVAIGFVTLMTLLTYAWKLKVVIAHPDGLEIRGPFRSDFVTYHQISSVTSRGPAGPATIQLKVPCQFGESILYQPYRDGVCPELSSLFSTAQKTHPANALIEERVREAERGCEIPKDFQLTTTTAN